MRGDGQGDAGREPGGAPGQGAGGAGRKTTGIVKRVQKANLQRRRVVVNGAVRRVWLSARALRSLGAGRVAGLELA